MVKMSIGTGVDSSTARAMKARSGPSKDTPPVVITAPALSGAGRIGAPVTANFGVWGGSPAPGLSARWQRNGADIPGATGARYTPVPADDMADLRCVVTASNRAGTLMVATAPVRITYAPPVVAGGLADRSFDLAGGTREVETAGGFAGAALTFSVTGAGAGVDPATGLVSIPVSAALDAVPVTVTASNSGGSAAITFGVTVSMAGLAPSVLSAPTLSGTGRIGSPVSVAEGVWGGVPAPTLALRWQRNGVDIPGAAGASYTPVPADDAADLRCVVTASNSFGTTSAETGTVKVAYAAPVAAGNLFEEVFDQDAGSQTVDAAPDFTVAGDPGLGGVSWSVSGAGASIDSAGMVSVPTAAPVSAEAVTVTATNSGGFAESVFLVTVEGESGAASFDAALSPSIVTPGTHVTATPVYADGSGPTGNETFQWYEGGVAIPGATWPVYVARADHVSAADLTCEIEEPTIGTAASLPASVTDQAQGARPTLTPATYRAAYGAAFPGDTLWLAPGEYPDWVPPAKTFSPAVTLRSVDPDDPAVFLGLRLNNATTGLVLRDIRFEHRPTETSQATQTINIVNRGSSKITFLDCAFQSGVGINPARPTYLGLGVGVALATQGLASDVAVIGCAFSTWRNGIIALSTGTDRLTVEGCDGSNMSGDTFQMFAVDGLRFKNNVMRDFKREVNDHPDALQFTNAGGTRGMSDVWIWGNVVHSGAADKDWTQSFFLSSENPSLRHSDINVINNLVYNAHTHGITLIDADGAVIRNNTVIRNFAMASETPGTEMPRINIGSRCTGVVVTRNVVDRINNSAGASTILSDNYLLTYSGPGTQAEFVGGLAANSTMAQLQPRGAILAGGYGATYSDAPLGPGVGVERAFAMDDLPFDRFVFNSADNATAVVKLTGQGTTGDSIRIRGESAGGSTSWSSGATVDGDGNWTATLSVPLAEWDEWYTPVARIGTDDRTRIGGANRFGCGHVILAMGQSENEYWLNQLSTYNGAGMSAPAGAVDENAVFVLLATANEGDIKVVPHTTNAYANNVTISKACMFLARMLAEGAPGHKFAIGDGAVPGTGRGDLFSDRDDANTDTTNNRDWRNFEAVADTLTGGSRRAGENLTEIGHLLDAAWFTNDAGILATSWDRYVPGYFGQTVAGGTFTLGANDAGGRSVDHCLWDLTGANRGLFSTATKWNVTPPNNYADYTGILKNSLTFATDAANGRIGYESALANLKALHASSRVDAIRGVFGPSPHIYRSGTWTGSAWGNQIHPDTGSDFGTPYLAMHMGVTMLMACGVGYAVPEIEGVTVAAGGASAVVRVSLPNGGTLTTGRIKHGLSAPSPSPAHRQPAHGFEILRSGGGTTALTPSGFTATITNAGTGSGAARYGEVTITPTVAFGAGDTLHYARGGAYGLLDYQAENAALLQLDMLVENVPALTGYDGIPVGARVKDLRLSAAVRGFSPAWYIATGQVVNTAYGTNFDGVANSGIKKQTFIATYAPGANDGNGANASIAYLYKQADMFLASNGIIYIRNLTTNSIPLSFAMSTIGSPAVWRARDYAIVVTYDTTQANAADRVKGRIVDLTTGSEYAMTTSAGSVPAQNADVEAFADVGVGNCYGAKTAGFVQQSSGAFERLQAWVDVAADLADLSGLHVGGTLQDPARAGAIAAAGGGTLSAGQLVLDIHGANLPLGVNPGAGPDFPKTGAGNWVAR